MTSRLRWSPLVVRQGKAASSAYWRAEIIAEEVLVLAWRRRRLKRPPSRRYSIPTKSDDCRSRWDTRVIATRSRLKMIGARTQPCFTQTSTGKLEDWDPAMTTWAHIPVLNCCSMAIKVGGQPNVRRMFQRRSRLTVSNAFVRSTKAKYMSWCCSRHFSCSFLANLYVHIHMHIYIYSTPLRKETGVFEISDRFIGLRCHNYALYLFCLWIIQYAETFIRYIVTYYETYIFVCVYLCVECVCVCAYVWSACFHMCVNVFISYFFSFRLLNEQ